MKRALVVDDEFAILRALVSELSALGFQVESAGHGREALAMLEVGRFELVLCDLGMPVMNGAALIERARQKGLLAGAYVVVMAHPHERVAVEDVLVLRKPVRLPALHALAARLA